MNGSGIRTDPLMTLQPIWVVGTLCDKKLKVNDLKVLLRDLNVDTKGMKKATLLETYCDVHVRCSC